MSTNSPGNSMRRMYFNPNQCFPSQPPEDYQKLRWVVSVVIAGVAFRVLPKIFAYSACAGAAYQLFSRRFPEFKFATSVEEGVTSCSEGCSVVLGEALGLKLNKKTSFVISALFFLCHIEHHRFEMVPVVGAMCGMKVTELSFDYLNKVLFSSSEIGIG
jgi:hypothetical protein